jgi:hypothetical protein
MKDAEKIAGCEKGLDPSINAKSAKPFRDVGEVKRNSLLLVTVTALFSDMLKVNNFQF